MNSTPARRSFSWSGAVCLVTLSALAFAMASGCSKSEAAPKAGAPVESAPTVAATAKAEADNYAAEIKANGAYSAGQEGTVDVLLTVKGDYHTNKQYPYKFKLADPAPDGVTFPKPVLVRADGTFEEKRGTFKAPFVAAKAGKATISGTLFLSVCSDANCIMDKVPLELTVDVK